MLVSNFKWILCCAVSNGTVAPILIGVLLIGGEQLEGNKRFKFKPAYNGGFEFNRKCATDINSYFFGGDTVKGERMVFFDYGGVLFDFQVDFFLESTARMFGVSALDILRFFSRPKKRPFFRRMDIGLNEKNIRDAFCRHFGKDVPMDEFREKFSSALIVNDLYRQEQVLKKLREAKVRLGAISNINAVHASYIEERFGRVLFDFPRPFRFYSFALGLRKDASGEMFLKACELCGADPKKSILVDDLVENVVGVKNAGGRGILFRGFHRLEYDLIQLGVLA